MFPRSFLPVSALAILILGSVLVSQERRQQKTTEDLFLHLWAEHPPAPIRTATLSDEEFLLRWNAAAEAMNGLADDKRSGIADVNRFDKAWQLLKSLHAHPGWLSKKKKERD